MIDLSHVYFEGEDQAEALRPHGAETKPAVRTSQNIGALWVSRPGELESAPLNPLIRFILRRSGLDSEAYQTKALNRRFSACLRVLRATCAEDAKLRLRRNPELTSAALSAVLIGVSEFFRDEKVFEHLRKVVLPEEVLKKHATLRIYSAGCSLGLELYSVAMVLDELGALEQSHLLGVDCRPDAIEQARSGCFAVSDLKGLDVTRRQRYFRVEGRRAFILSRLRENPVWHLADFGVFRNTEPWDLILFRNVAIYLETDYANRIWHLLDRQIKLGGVIVTGSADRPPEDLGWRREAVCIYRKPLTPI